MLVLAAPAVSAQSLELAEDAAAMCLFERALKILSDAPKGERESRRGRMFRARLLVQVGRGAEAIVVLDSIPQSDDRAQEADRLLALALARSAAGQIAASERDLVAAEKLGADKAVVQGALGMLRLEEGTLDAAEQELRKALMQDPRLSGAVFNLGLVAARRGNIAEAAALVRQAWHLGYKDPNQIRSEPDLKVVRSTPGLIDDLQVGVVPRCATY